MQVFYWTTSNPTFDNTHGWRDEAAYVTDQDPGTSQVYTVSTAIQIAFIDSTAVEAAHRAAVKADVLTRFSHTLTDIELIRYPH